MLRFDTIGIAGDSIADTASSRVNFPTYLGPLLGVTTIHNVAVSGSHWASSTYLSTSQWMETQAAALITLKAGGASFDIIFLHCGTNGLEHIYQSGPSIVGGSYAVAHALEISALDRTREIDGQRYTLHVLRQAFPDIPMVGLLPLQRSEFDVTAFPYRQTVEDERRMYRDYDCLVIDGAKCGILGQFEPGRFIYSTDPPHPDPTGSELWANYINSELRALLRPHGTY